MGTFVRVLVFVNKRITSWNEWTAEGYIQGHPVQSRWTTEKHNTIQ